MTAPARYNANIRKNLITEGGGDVTGDCDDFLFLGKIGMRTRDEILEKIRRLFEIRVDRGATAGEAELAAAHAARLLQEYQLTMFDVRAETFDEQVVEE